MARKFYYGDTVPASPALTSRFGAQSAGYTDKELFKLVKGTTESGHLLCAAGDQISGQVVAIENATSDGFTIAAIQRHDRLRVTADGLQATPGTGAIALGDQVVCGTVVAAGTALGANNPKVCKATVQVGTTVPADLAAVAAHMALIASGNIWKVVSLGSAGTGAIGTEIVIERVFNFG